MELPKDPHLPGKRCKGAERDTATLGTSVSTSAHWPSIKETAVTWYLANRFSSLFCLLPVDDLGKLLKISEPPLFPFL